MAKTKYVKDPKGLPQLKKRAKALGKSIEQKITSYQSFKEDCMCYPFIGMDISPGLVDDTFQELRTKYKDCDGRLNIIVDCGGGDIDAAYNLGMLFRKYGTKQLNFLIPRWAKSAATMLVCSGDMIYMSPVAELGPLDPQITELNPLEGRLEQFSPLHIESTLDMIRKEFKDGNEKLAKGLMERLQFPLTLGGFIKYHEIGEQYLSKLLESRMLANDQDSNVARDKARVISKKLTSGYADHGFCINIDEAKSIGLRIEDLEGDELDIIWEIHQLNKERREIVEGIKEIELLEKIKGLPPSILDKLPHSLRDGIRKSLS
jgi:hypothetical protein